MAAPRGKTLPDRTTMLKSILAQSSVNHLAAYLAAGRRLQDLSSADLDERFAGTLELTVNEVGGAGADDLHRDVVAEYAIRGISPPYDAHREMMDNYRARLQKWTNEFTDEQRAEMDERILEAYLAGQGARQ